MIASSSSLLGFKFERVSVPQATDIIAASVDDTVRKLGAVDASVLTYFSAAAKRLIEEKGAEVALASALAVISGHTEPIKERSILCSAAGFTTVLMRSSSEIRTMSAVWNNIKRFLFEEADDKVRGMRMCADQKGAVFDVPSEFKAKVLEVAKSAPPYVQFSLPTVLPELMPQKFSTPEVPRWKQERMGRSGGGGGGGGFRGGRGGHQRSRSAYH